MIARTRAASYLLAASLAALAVCAALAEVPVAPQAPVQSAIAMPTAPTGLVRPRTLSCSAPAEITHLDRALVRTARRISAGKSLTIVAIGSSSTAGAGATSPAASYPGRLEALLKDRFPGLNVRVLNRGINGEEMPEMLARFQQGVIAEDPDLVLWQLGTNSVLRSHDVTRATPLIREGLALLRASGADVVLIDPQFAPKVIARPEAPQMVQLIDQAAREGRVGVFHRFAIMRHWHEATDVSFDEFLSPDGLHMNDWSYDCLARLLSSAIVEASNRATLSAGGGPTPR
jgi:lysophospholipase L1-like esterase